MESLAESILLPSHRVKLSDGKLNRIEELLWSWFRKVDEVFHGFDDLNVDEKQRGRSNNASNPLKDFISLEDETTALFKATVKQPRVMFTALISAEAPTRLPGFTEYRRKFNPRATEREYSTWRRQVQRRFHFLRMPEGYIRWSKGLFSSLKRASPGHWTNRTLQNYRPYLSWLQEEDLQVALDALLNEGTRINGLEHINEPGVAEEGELLSIYTAAENFFYSILFIMGERTNMNLERELSNTRHN